MQSRQLRVCILVDLNSTFKDAVKIFCLRTCLPEEDLVFLCEGKKLSVNNGMTLGQIGFKDGSRITVIKMNYIVGA